MPQPSTYTPFTIGPCAIVMGDPYKSPIDANDAIARQALMYLGPTDGDVVVTPELEVVMVNADQAGGAIDAYGSWKAFGVSAPMLDAQKARLASYWPGTTLSTDATALGFKSGAFRIPTRVMGLIPVDQISQGFDAPDAVWLLNALCSNVGAFTFRRVQGASANPAIARQTMFTSLHKSVLEVKPSVVIPDAGRVGWFGAITKLLPSGETNLWTMPSLTQLY